MGRRELDPSPVVCSVDELDTSSIGRPIWRPPLTSLKTRELHVNFSSRPKMREGGELVGVRVVGYLMLVGLRQLDFGGLMWNL